MADYKQRFEQITQKFNDDADAWKRLRNAIDQYLNRTGLAKATKARQEGDTDLVITWAGKEIEWRYFFRHDADSFVNGNEILRDGNRHGLGSISIRPSEVETADGTFPINEVGGEHSFFTLIGLIERA